MAESVTLDALRIGKISVQAESATPMEGQKNWYILHEEKRAHIPLYAEPEVRGKDPKIRVHYGSQTVTIDCGDSPLTAEPIWNAMFVTLYDYVGSDTDHLFSPVSPESENEMRLCTSDPHRLVRTLRRMREDGPLTVNG